MPFTVPANLPNASLTAGQNAWIAAANNVSASRQSLESAFTNMAALFPLSGTNAYGLTLAQMQTALGAPNYNEYVAAGAALLTAINAFLATTDPTHDTWAQQGSIRPYYAALGVTIPPGF